MNFFRLRERSKGMRMQDSSERHPSLIVWFFHWVSALLVVYLLATSLASGLGLSQRISPGNWLDWHLSVGIAVLTITAIRLWTSHPWRDVTRSCAIKKFDFRATKSVLLLVVFLTSMVGLTIFQKSPLGRAGIVFGVLPMPTLIRLNHSVHSLVIDLHIALAYLIAVLMIVHIITGLKTKVVQGRSRFATMLRPWRRKR